MLLLLLQRWIKKKNRRVKYVRAENDVIPAAKRVKLTPWQAYMKDFGQTNGKYAQAALYVVT